MKTLIISAVAGLALALPVATYAQSDNETGLSADARYCGRLAQDYAAAHPAMLLSDGTMEQKPDCLGDPEGTIASITSQMNEERMPIPPRP
jgi:hypothetical protein